MKMRKPELLLPAGNLENLKTAIRYGADAVYLGGQKFGLRAKADNFTLQDMKEGVEYAHAHDAKVYLTVNIYAHNDDIEGIREYFKEIKGIPFDALLISDPGVLMMEREILPEIPVHISTQANNTNYLTWKFWKAQGAERVVAARELSLAEIRRIHEEVGEEMEIEAFIHGAMCISYSGRCLLSNYFTSRDANRGACTHPCRWKYVLMEESRPGEYLPIEEDERGSYILNSRDLCMIGYIPELCEAGISSFKIEGRMKTALYVAVTASAYRRAIDDYFSSEELYRKNIPDYMREISMCTTREFTTGFYFRKPTEEDQIYTGNTYRQDAVFLGEAEAVDPDGGIHISQKNKFSVGEEVQVMPFRGEAFSAKVLRILNEEGGEQESAPHPKQALTVYLSCETGEPNKIESNKIEPGMMLRKVNII
jgi:putative protease